MKRRNNEKDSKKHDTRLKISGTCSLQGLQNVSCNFYVLVKTNLSSTAGMYTFALVDSKVPLYVITNECLAYNNKHYLC